MKVSEQRYRFCQQLSVGDKVEIQKRLEPDSRPFSVGTVVEIDEHHNISVEYRRPFGRMEKVRFNRYGICMPWNKQVQFKVKMKPIEEFATRQLMEMLKKARIDDQGYGVANQYSAAYTFEEIKAELDTREHVPNKAEAKEIRRQKALEKKNR